MAVAFCLIWRRCNLMVVHAGLDELRQLLIAAEHQSEKEPVSLHHTRPSQSHVLLRGVRGLHHLPERQRVYILYQIGRRVSISVKMNQS